jgi:hypothetical protein
MDESVELIIFLSHTWPNNGIRARACLSPWSFLMHKCLSPFGYLLCESISYYRNIFGYSLRPSSLSFIGVMVSSLFGANYFGAEHTTRNWKVTWVFQLWTSCCDISDISQTTSTTQQDLWVNPLTAHILSWIIQSFWCENWINKHISLSKFEGFDVWVLYGHIFLYSSFLIEHRYHFHCIDGL